MSIESVVRKYEVMVLFSAALSTEQVKKELQTVKELITSRNGAVQFEESWGKRKLAYRIRKEDFGFYEVLLFTLDPAAVKEVDKELRMNKTVLRHLITMPPKEYQPITAGEVEASEERHFTEFRAKKASGGRRPRPSTAAVVEKPAAVVQTETEVVSKDTPEERARKLDKILSSDLNI